jgi:hypothetical protein
MSAPALTTVLCHALTLSLCLVCRYGGQAVAETVWGSNVPSGKLPFTMYYSNYTDNLDIDDMSMTAGPGRTYRYYNGCVQYLYLYPQRRAIPCAANATVCVRRALRGAERYHDVALRACTRAEVLRLIRGSVCFVSLTVFTLALFYSFLSDRCVAVGVSCH